MSLNNAERDLYLHVLRGWCTQSAFPGCITAAPVAAARAVLRVRLAMQQTAHADHSPEPTSDDIREMAREAMDPQRERVVDLTMIIADFVRAWDSDDEPLILRTLAEARKTLR